MYCNFHFSPYYTMALPSAYLLKNIDIIYIHVHDSYDIHMYIYIYVWVHTTVCIHTVYIYVHMMCFRGDSQTHGLRRWWTQQLGSRCHRVSVLKSDVATIARHGLTPTQCIGNCFFLETVCVKKVMCQNYIYTIFGSICNYKYDKYI